MWQDYKDKYSKSTSNTRCFRCTLQHVTNVSRGTSQPLGEPCETQISHTKYCTQPKQHK